MLAVVLPLNRNIAQARQRIATKQGDLAFIQSAVPQLVRGRARARRAAATANRSWCSSTARRAKAVSANRCRAASQPATRACASGSTTCAFDALVAWLARLSQSHGVRVESAEIETAGEAGLVNAGLVLKAG